VTVRQMDGQLDHSYNSRFCIASYADAL